MWRLSLTSCQGKHTCSASSPTKSNSRLVKEKELSVKAGSIVGDLYRAFEGQYKNLGTDPREQRSLNVLIVRLVFLLYAEDAGLLQEHQAFGRYLQQFQAPQMRQALIDLFKVLDTPDGTGGTENRRDAYLEESLAAFPYVNGGLFAEEDIVIPQFTEQMRHDLILNASIAFDWKDISPTIFGAVFESTLNPETRRSGGMHYTSIENIHKVIDPLFLDEFESRACPDRGREGGEEPQGQATRLPAQACRNQHLRPGLRQRQLPHGELLEPQEA